MLDRVSIVQVPAVSAIYFALLQCGYEFYSLEKSAQLISTLESFCTEQEAYRGSFFAEVRQNTCDVYPYWPRAAILETACFYLDGSNSAFEQFERFYEKIVSAVNILPEEREESFWKWMKLFPAAMSETLKTEAFQAYYTWETEWIARQNELHQRELLHTQETLEQCAAAYGSGILSVRIILNPIKCAYSSDYNIIEDRLYFSSGIFQTQSVVHEFLHPIVHPYVIGNREAILRYGGEYPGIDVSYLLDGSEGGRLNAAEEYLVRELTQRCVQEELPNNLDNFVQQAMGALMDQSGDKRTTGEAKP